MFRNRLQCKQQTENSHSNAVPFADGLNGMGRSGQGKNHVRKSSKLNSSLLSENGWSSERERRRTEGRQGILRKYKQPNDYHAPKTDGNKTKSWVER